MIDKPWSVVTGATSGIGASYARFLASKGYNLLMVGRRKEKIEGLATNLTAVHGVITEVILADLSQVEDLEMVLERVSKLPKLRILINNAGFGLGAPVSDPENEGRHIEMLDVHVRAALRLIQTVLPLMFAQNEGIIINVSSISAYFPIPRGATYGATKAFLNLFSEALQLEVLDRGIKVQALCPGFTHTDFHERMGLQAKEIRWRNRLGWIDPDRLVRHSFSKLRSAKVVYIPGLKYKLLVRLATKIPKRLYYAAVRRILR